MSLHALQYMFLELGLGTSCISKRIPFRFFLIGNCSTCYGFRLRVRSGCTFSNLVFLYLLWINNEGGCQIIIILVEYRPLIAGGALTFLPLVLGFWLIAEIHHDWLLVKVCVRFWFQHECVLRAVFFILLLVVRHLRNNNIYKCIY